MAPLRPFAITLKAISRAAASLLVTVLLSGCGEQRDQCYLDVYAKADGGPEDGPRDPAGCSSETPASGVSSDYLVRGRVIYFKSEGRSTYGTCVGGLGSHSSIHGGCLLGSTSYTITSKSLYPLDPAPDPATFRSIGGGFATDKTRVYREQFAIDGLKSLGPGVSMQRLPTTGPDARPGDLSPYYRYGDSIVFENRRVAGADAQTFQSWPLKGRDGHSIWRLARDKSRIYYSGWLLDGSDPDSFIADTQSSAHDARRQWVFDFDDFGVVSEPGAKRLGGHYVSATYWSPAGQRYRRVLWERVEHGTSRFYPLPGDGVAQDQEVTVLPVQCQEHMRGQPEFRCSPKFRVAKHSEMVPIGDKVYYQGKPILDADARTFQAFDFGYYADDGARDHPSQTYAIDAQALHVLEGRSGHATRVRIEGAVVGLIPDAYGWPRLIADSRDVYQVYGGWPEEQLCRYDSGASVFGLALVHRSESAGEPAFVLAGTKYRYVFYAHPDADKGYVEEIATGRRLRLFGAVRNENCGVLR